MNNTYIPNIIKEKLSVFFNHFYGLVYLLIFIFLIVSLFSFDINDNSFLTKSSQTVGNLAGEIGSYVSSFILYTFGLTGYMFTIFFLIMSFLTFIKKRPQYFFIRLLLFLVSLILIPQSLININLDINFINQIDDWGVISENLYLIYQNRYIIYALSFIVIITFLHTK